MTAKKEKPTVGKSVDKLGKTAVNSQAEKTSAKQSEPTKQASVSKSKSASKVLSQTKQIPPVIIKRRVWPD